MTHHHNASCALPSPSLIALTVPPQLNAMNVMILINLHMCFSHPIPAACLMCPSDMSIFLALQFHALTTVLSVLLQPPTVQCAREYITTTITMGQVNAYLLVPPSIQGSTMFASHVYCLVWIVRVWLTTVHHVL